MKKVLSLLFTLAFLGCLLVSARVPEDGEFTSMDPSVVVGNAAANGVPLEFIGCEGAWARRAIYQGEYVKLDGFKMVLSNVSLAKGSQIALCFHEGVNPWVDAETMLFGVSTSTTDQKAPSLNAPNGYLYVRQLPDIGNEKPYPVEPVALNAPLGDEVTIEFKKNGSDWQFIVNGQAITISDAIMTQDMKFSLEELLFSIGDCPGIGSKNTYTVKYLPSLDGDDDPISSVAPVDPPESSEQESSAPASSASPNTSSNVSSKPDSSNLSDNSSDVQTLVKPGEKNNTALIVIIVVTVIVVLACAGVVVFLLLKKKPAGGAPTDSGNGKE